MISFLVLKSMYKLSDEKLVEERWEMNAYFQYFGGLEHQKWGQPCAASDLVHFRQRKGESGVEKIFRHSIEKHGKNGEGLNVSVDSTVQEKNITFPTDAKLHKKIIDKCVAKSKKKVLCFEGATNAPVNNSFDRPIIALIQNVAKKPKLPDVS